MYVRWHVRWRRQMVPRQMHAAVAPTEAPRRMLSRGATSPSIPSARGARKTGRSNWISFFYLAFLILD